jgi:hypothetical protein
MALPSCGKPPTAAASAKVLSLLPKMAEAYRRQVEAGLNGDARAASQARAIIGQLIGGAFKLVPEGGHLVTHFGLHRCRCCGRPEHRDSW